MLTMRESEEGTIGFVAWIEMACGDYDVCSRSMDHEVIRNGDGGRPDNDAQPACTEDSRSESNLHTA